MPRRKTDIIEEDTVKSKKMCNATTSVRSHQKVSSQKVPSIKLKIYNENYRTHNLGRFTIKKYTLTLFLTLF